MVRKRVNGQTTSYIADGVDDKGQRRRVMFNTAKKAKDWEDKMLSHNPKMSVGYLFPLLYRECWPEGESRDPSVLGRVNELTLILGKSFSIRSIDKFKIEEIERELRVKGNSINTIANKLNALSKMLKRAEDRGFIPFVPRFKVKRDTKAKRTFVLTVEQENVMLNNLPERWRPFAMFLIDTASRGFSECKHLEWHHVDFESKTLSFWYNKTDEPRSVRMSSDVIVILKTLKEAGWEKPWAILGTKGMTDRMWHQFWVKARKAAGLPDKGRGAVVPYTFRHTTATRLSRDKMDVLRLAKFLGHANLSTTQRYVHHDVSDQDEFVEKLDRRRLTA
ncbi:MAG TPA: site-specific integrase [Rhodopseudomonas sp.]|uniref:tyrosine-type recombinase/integrase n=1 Tax=Rhodopseudomonas sp. TaxID=1078 RepID=UPI002ED8E08C